MSELSFAQKVGSTVVNGFATIGLSVGRRLGLFDALSKLAQCQDDAVTSHQLADSLNFKERYVREWLGGMVCADLVDHVEIEGENRYWLATYRLPALVGEMCATLPTELFVACFDNHNNVEACFAKDGPLGTHVDEYPGLHAFLASRPVPWSQPQNVERLLGDDSLVQKLEKGIRVLEIGCGAAMPTKALATRFPNSTFVASDLSENVLEKAKVRCKDLANVSYEVLDACQVPADRREMYEMVMLLDVFHDVSYPDQLLSGVYNMLTEGGLFMMSDIDMLDSLQENKTQRGDSGSMLYLISTLYCLPTSVNYPNGAGLGACVGPTAIEQLFKDSGLVNISYQTDDLGLTFRAYKVTSDSSSVTKKPKMDS